MKGSRIRQYELHHELGAGAGGVVYYATDTQLMRPVVIKILHRRKASDEHLRARMLEEARLVSAIEHPNVASVFEVGEHEGRLFIVMQYLPGQTLQQLIDAEPLNLHALLAIGIQMADGLAAAHGRGIIHRDLKPSNVMVTEGGVVKILDFGLARRKTLEPDLDGVRPDGRAVAAASSRFGTTAYMAPEQFVTRRSSRQTDLFALGVILYEMATGQHPFWAPGMTQEQLAMTIQSRTPPGPRQMRPELPEALGEIIVKLLQKQPSNRYEHATEVRDALKTLMKAQHLEMGVIPGEASALLPAPAPERQGAKPSLLSSLADLLSPGKPTKAPENSIAVVPFQNLNAEPETRFYGLALADAVATRLARLPAVVVRPPSTLLSVASQPLDPLEAGRRLVARHVLTATFSRNDDGFALNWQLLDVADRAVRSGGTLAVPSLDLVTVQNQIADEVFAALHADGELQAPPSDPSSGAESLPEDVSDQYLEARALLTSFALRASHFSDLDHALAKFEAVTHDAPDFAPAHAGLGITHLQYVRNGFGGQEHLLEAQRHLERAFALDPASTEARVYLAYTLLWQGEKTQARHDIQRLLRTNPHNPDVCLGAALALLQDGLLGEALRMFQRVLRLNPAAAALVYNYRARIFLYQDRLEEAVHEIDRGLALNPAHFHLRTTLGYWLFRKGEFEEAIATLERVLEENEHLRLAYPTLGICYVAAGRHEDAERLMTPTLRAAAKVEGEMAYRVGTYYAAARDVSEAIHWLRKAVYLGYENYPWFAGNPVWEPIEDDEDYRALLAELSRVYAKNQELWKGTLA